MCTFFLLFAGFLAIRLASFSLYAFVPEAIRTDSITIFSGLIIALFLFLYKKNPLLGFFVLLTELALGGAGHYLEFFGLSLRTCLLILYLGLFFVFERKKINFSVFPLSFRISAAIFFCALLLSIVIGYKNENPISFIVQDSIPFLFLGLIFPLVSYWKDIIASSYSKLLIKAFVWGNALFSTVTLLLFSSGIVQLQEPYYKWFRDVAIGKITDMGTGFFRIVLPEHLPLIPILIFFIASLLYKQPKKHLFRIFEIIIIITIIINFSRIYLLAILVAYLVFFKKNHLKKWLTEGIILLFTLWITFSTVHLVTSAFNSFGWELFTSRAKTIVQPDSEISSATRLTLLPHILNQIKKSPLLGSGLGNTINYVDPNTYEQMSTRQYDWGYLEVWAELGLAGIAALLSLIIGLVYQTVRQYPEIAAPATALAITNLTAPTFTHVLGIIPLVFLLVFWYKKQYTTSGN